MKDAIKWFIAEFLGIMLVSDHTAKSLSLQREWRNKMRHLHVTTEDALRALSAMQDKHVALQKARSRQVRAFELLIGWSHYYRSAITSRERAIFDYLRSNQPPSTAEAHPFSRWNVMLATPEEVNAAQEEGRSVKLPTAFTKMYGGAFVQDN